MKILYFDLETAPILGYVWRAWDTSLIGEPVKDWQIICFSYKWEGDRKVQFVRPEKKDPWNDKAMVQKLWDLFNEADVIVAHNLNRFDKKKSNAMFLRHGLTPPSDYKCVDTLQVVKSNFSNTSNRLDSMGKLLNIGKKVEHEGFRKLFEGCMLDNDPKVWRKMKRYNDQDVTLLQKLYKVLRPWIKNHPIDPDNLDGCPKCQSKNFVKNGTRGSVYKYQRYHCKHCGCWFRGERIKQPTPKYRN